MMNVNKDPEERFKISFSDIFSLFRRFKILIFGCALVFAIGGAWMALTQPILYQAQATFREKGVRSSNVGVSPIAQILGVGNLVGGESEAASMMTSRKILKDVIEKLHLQGRLQAKSDIETLSTLMKNNFRLAWAAVFGSSPFPILKDITCPLKIQNLHYTGETPLSFTLDLQEDGSYKVRDLQRSDPLVGWGKLGEPFQFEQLSMTIVSTHPPQPLVAQSFSLSVSPLANTAKNLIRILQVEPSKLDKSLLILKIEHRNRHLATQLINEVMESYQAYLKKYHLEMAMSQLDYLDIRQEQLKENLTDIMNKHAKYLSEDVSKSGVIESEKEIEFLVANQHEYKRKLLDNELEIKRLTNIQPSNIVHYDRYTSNDGDAININQMLAEMRQLKQQRDALEIKVKKRSVEQVAHLQQSLEKQLNELAEVQQYLVELRVIIEQVQQGKIPDTQSNLFKDSRYLLAGWFERLQNAQVESPNKWKETQANFQFYLNNLERLFSVNERILQERLSHQQNPSEEYQGITLEIAQGLYLDYSKLVVQLEGNIRQNLFFIHQIEDPHFEITSLSAGLEDPVSIEMIRKASQLVLNFRDQNNQSVREQDRIKEELDLQRTFLTMHLKQMVHLMELNKQLFDEKIFALQNISLDLIHQNISLIENNLQDYLKSRLYNLQQERGLIQRHLDNIHSEMALIPQKWVAEKLLTQDVTTNQHIVEEIVKLVESTNISHNLDVIQSAPIDTAIPPVHPLPPKMMLWGFLGFLLGGCLGSGLVIATTLGKGLKVSTQNLELMGYHVSGTLTSPLCSPAHHQLQVGNLNTLRRLQAYFDPPLAESSSKMQGAKLLLLIEGQGVDYATELSNLLSKRGCRVLTLDLNFVETNTTTSGLLQYLQGEVAAPSIQKGSHGDKIAAGGASPFIVEMLRSPLFQKLLEQLKLQYDWILAVSSALPCSVEAESILPLFPNIAVTLQQEKTEELNIYACFLEDGSQQKLTFILDDPNYKRGFFKG